MRNMNNILLNTVHLHANTFQLKLDVVGSVCGGRVSEGSSDEQEHAISLYIIYKPGVTT